MINSLPPVNFHRLFLTIYAKKAVNTFLLLLLIMSLQSYSIIFTFFINTGFSLVKFTIYSRRSI